VAVAGANARGDVGRGPGAETLEPYLANDLRVDHRRRDKAGRGGATVAAVPAGRTRCVGIEE
jgi:hypothetical protein